MFPYTTSAAAAKQGDTERNAFRVLAAPAASAKPTSTNWFDAWNGPVVATATAVGALVLSEQHGGVLGEIGGPAEIDSAYQGDLSELIVGSMHWLARRQNKDGGWSSIARADGESSDLFTSMIVRATFQLTGIPAAYPDLGDRMIGYVKQQGGAERLKSAFGPFASPTLLASGCSALAEAIDWRQVPAIPIERATFHAKNSRVEFWTDRQPVLPAIIALGVAGYSLHKPYNPLTNWRRSQSCHGAVNWLAQTQGDDGSFAASIPVTSVVLMSLASIGQTTNQMVRRGVEYLFAQVRGDASWPGSGGRYDSAAQPS